MGEVGGRGGGLNSFNLSTLFSVPFEIGKFKSVTALCRGLDPTRHSRFVSRVYPPCCQYLARGQSGRI